MSNSNPGWYYGYVPTAGIWNYQWSIKQDYSPILDTLIAQGGGPSFIAPASWTPTDGSGAGLTFTGVSAEYTVIGNIVFASAQLTYPATASSADAVISGLPYPIISEGYAVMPAIARVSAAAATLLLPIQGGNTASIQSISTGAAVTNVTLTSKTISFQLVYPLS